jgi:hypothetical protein
MQDAIYCSTTLQTKEGEGANINPLNAELNPICHLLALLGAHHILHVSRIRVNEQNETLISLSVLLFQTSQESRRCCHQLPFVSTIHNAFLGKRKYAE